MRSRDDRHDAEVDDTQPARAVHAQLRVDDAALIAGQHRARGRGVVHGRQVLLQPHRELGVGRDGRPGVDLARKEAGERLRRGELAHELGRLDERFEICTRVAASVPVGKGGCDAGVPMASSK